MQGSTHNLQALQPNQPPAHAESYGPPRSLEQQERGHMMQHQPPQYQQQQVGPKPLARFAPQPPTGSSYPEPFGSHREHHSQTASQPMMQPSTLDDRESPYVQPTLGPTASQQQQQQPQPPPAKRQRMSDQLPSMSGGRSGSPVKSPSFGAQPGPPTSSMRPSADMAPRPEPMKSKYVTLAPRPLLPKTSPPVIPPQQASIPVTEPTSIAAIMALNLPERDTRTPPPNQDQPFNGSQQQKYSMEMSSFSLPPPSSTIPSLGPGRSSTAEASMATTSRGTESVVTTGTSSGSAPSAWGPPQQYAQRPQHSGQPNRPASAMHISQAIAPSDEYNPPQETYKRSSQVRMIVDEETEGAPSVPPTTTQEVSGRPSGDNRNWNVRETIYQPPPPPVSDNSNFPPPNSIAGPPIYGTSGPTVNDAPPRRGIRDEDDDYDNTEVDNRSGSGSSTISDTPPPPVPKSTAGAEMQSVNPTARIGSGSEGRAASSTPTTAVPVGDEGKPFTQEAASSAPSHSLTNTAMRKSPPVESNLKGTARTRSPPVSGRGSETRGGNSRRSGTPTYSSSSSSSATSTALPPRPLSTIAPSSGGDGQADDGAASPAGSEVLAEGGVVPMEGIVDEGKVPAPIERTGAGPRGNNGAAAAGPRRGSADAGSNRGGKQKSRRAGSGMDRSNSDSSSNTNGSKQETRSSDKESLSNESKDKGGVRNRDTASRRGAGGRRRSNGDTADVQQQRTSQPPQQQPQRILKPPSLRRGGSQSGKKDTLREKEKTTIPTSAEDEIPKIMAAKLASVLCNHQGSFPSGAGGNKDVEAGEVVEDDRGQTKGKVNGYSAATAVENGFGVGTGSAGRRGSAGGEGGIGKEGKILRFSHAHNVAPPQWRPQIILPADPDGVTRATTTAHNPPNANTMRARGGNNSGYKPIITTLGSREILPLRPGCCFLLEERYQLLGVLPRSYFNILQQYNVGHTFVFDWPDPDHVFWQELAGMRKTAYFSIKEEETGERWEPDDILRIISERAMGLLNSRKLPLVLDLDDTLVRVVGNEPGRYVPESALPFCKHRVRELKDGRRVVLTERVHEFLKWSSRYFELSVCSLGDQPYVDMVVSVLDPNRSTISGIQYSARGEYLHIIQSANPRRPPKDLLSLYAFCAVTNPNSAPVDPLIVDDNVTMWPVDQQDNIIVVREAKTSTVWNVNLFPVVQMVLQHVHAEFFRQLDAWWASDRLSPPPSAAACYKEYLRRELSLKIAAEPSSLPMQRVEQEQPEPDHDVHQRQPKPANLSANVPATTSSVSAVAVPAMSFPPTPSISTSLPPEPTVAAS
ncbi:hypothetical protein HK102_001059 [Quaeritorhiza haematococci]|nr:hypothetical protein HK102_001059 [Quaeritorhiza haematococci]